MTDLNVRELSNEFPQKLRQVIDIENIFCLLYNFSEIVGIYRSLKFFLFIYSKEFIYLPLKSIQNSSNRAEIIKFLRMKMDQAPEYIFHRKFDANIINFGINSSNERTFILMTDKFILYRYNIEYWLDTDELDVCPPTGELEYSCIRYPYVIIVMNDSDKKKVYVHKAFSANIWCFQCEIEGYDSLYVHRGSYCVCLYVINQSGLHGCVVDLSQKRVYPRPLVTVLNSNNLRYVKSTGGFYLFDNKLNTLYQVDGSNLKSREFATESNGFNDYIVLSSRLFAYNDNGFCAFNMFGGNLIKSFDFPSNSKIYESISESYGVSFITNKTIYSVSITDIPPFFDIESLNENMIKNCISKTGTVAVPLLLLSGVSCYYSVSRLNDHIRDELSSEKSSNDLQTAMRPYLTKIHDIFGKKPV